MKKQYRLRNRETKQFLYNKPWELKDGKTGYTWSTKEAALNYIHSQQLKPKNSKINLVEKYELVEYIMRENNTHDLCDVLPINYIYQKVYGHFGNEARNAFMYFSEENWYSLVSHPFAMHVEKVRGMTIAQVIGSLVKAGIDKKDVLRFKNVLIFKNEEDMFTMTVKISANFKRIDWQPFVKELVQVKENENQQQVLYKTG